MNILTRRSRHLAMPALFLVTVLLSAGCGTTTLTATWHDRNYQETGILNDVLVIAVTRDDTVRRVYEDGFVARLAREQIRAIPSYTLSEPDLKPDKAAIEAAVAESGARSFLVTRYLGSDTKEQYRPPQRTLVFTDPYYSRFYGYYPMAYREVYEPGYTVTIKTVFMEANLYDAATGDLVWAVRSESINPSISRDYMEELVNLFTSDLKKSGLL